MKVLLKEPNQKMAERLTNSSFPLLRELANFVATGYTYFGMEFVVTL